MNTLNGLPIHIILIHAVVVLLPLSALLLVLTASSPTARRRFAGANALLALSVVVLVPLTTGAGEWLQQQVPSTELVRRHAELGGTAIIAAIAVALMAVVIWWREREATSIATAAQAPAPAEEPGPTGVATITKQTVARRTWLRPASKTVTRWIAVAAVLVAGAAVYDMYRIGDSGAKASWDGKVSSAPYIAG